jgi:hypothetical protein
MDSSDAGRLRLFNFGGAHAAGVLAMTALADFYNKHAAGRRNAEPPGPSQTGLVYAFQNGDSALVQRRYRRSFGGFVIRHSSFVIRRGFEARKLSYAVYAIHASPGMPRRFPSSKTFPLIRSR